MHHVQKINLRKNIFSQFYFLEQRNIRTFAKKNLKIYGRYKTKTFN